MYGEVAGERGSLLRFALFFGSVLGLRPLCSLNGCGCDWVTAAVLCVWGPPCSGSAHSLGAHVVLVLVQVCAFALCPCWVSVWWRWGGGLVSEELLLLLLVVEVDEGEGGRR